VESKLNGRVLIVGVGGLGVPAAWALARAGVRRLTLMDPDPVELSNLARQVIYRTADVGRPKVEAAADRLAAEFPGLEIDRLAVELDAANASGFIGAHDFTIDGTDNPRTKFSINDAAIGAMRPFGYGGVIGMTGQAMTVIPGRSACLRCLFEEPPGEAEIASCREAGIIGPVAGVIGEVQAAEAIRVLAGAAPRLAGRILTYDASAAAARMRIADVAARRGCACGAWSAAGREALPIRNQ